MVGGKVPPPWTDADGRPPEAGRTPDGAASEATRFLCAGAYLDERFATRVVEELFNHTTRAIAPSYGFDLRLVAIHCLAADRWRRTRDGLFAIVSVLMLATAPLTFVLYGIFWSGVGWTIEALRGGSAGLSRALSRVNRRTIALTLLAAALPFLMAPTWTFIQAHLSGFAAAAGHSPLSRRAGSVPAVPGPRIAPVLLRWLVLSVYWGIAGWFALYVIVLVDLAVRRWNVVQRLRLPAFLAWPERKIRLSRRRSARLDAIASEPLDNVTIYSGFKPFIGAGESLRPWSFAVPLAPARDRDGAVERFKVGELVTYVRGAIASIADGDGLLVGGAREPGDPLRGLVVTDRVLVSGLAVEGDGRFVPERAATPCARLRAEEMERVAGGLHGAARHYCAVHVASWRGEVVTSVFFHLSTDGDKLYCQWAPHVLRPIRGEYHEVDLMPDFLSPGQLLDLVAEAAVQTVPLVLGVPGRLVRDLRGGDSPGRGNVIDYGARLSVREIAMEALSSSFWRVRLAQLLPDSGRRQIPQGHRAPGPRRHSRVSRCAGLRHLRAEGPAGLDPEQRRQQRHGERVRQRRRRTGCRSPSERGDQHAGGRRSINGCRRPMMVTC